MPHGSRIRAVLFYPEQERIARTQNLQIPSSCKQSDYLFTEENLALAFRRGRHRTLMPGIRRAEREEYRRKLTELGLGLENRLTAKAGTLSGGQRQALTLLMATLQKPRLLLLDEHTAALDPHTSQAIMQLTNEIVSDQQLTCLMITHQVEDALRYGNCLIVLDAGKIVADFDQAKKAAMSRDDVLAFFS